MSATIDRPTTPPPRPAPQGDGTDDRHAERFRATARQIVTQLDIEQTMWQILEKEPKR
ncbi:MAG: hypothetical protein HN700_19870 [Verrucomicrobia bacterium]|jgi:hypothetical protein|nr:hypothetical protein [Verrucomicrobiota bacterium]